VSATPLERLAEFAAAVHPATLPEAVASGVREHLLDTVGVSLAATGLDTSAMAREVALAWGGPPQATVIGLGDRLTAPGAAFVNGVLAHSLDFDDTHLPSILHPSASIVPAVLAAAEAAGATTDQAVAAAAAGYEVCIRTGMAAYDRRLGNSVFFERGWHATSICGTLGSAVAAAPLDGLGPGRIRYDLRIADVRASRCLEVAWKVPFDNRPHCC